MSWGLITKKSAYLMVGSTYLKKQDLDDSTRVNIKDFFQDAGSLVINLEQVSEPLPFQPDIDESLKLAPPRGIWIWYLAQVGGVSRVIEICRNANCRRIYLKVDDARRGGKPNPRFWDDQCNEEIISAFKQEGIEVWGWGYTYGDDTQDAQVANIQKAFDAGIEGYVIDVEVEVLKTQNGVQNFKQFLPKVRAIVPQGRLGYSSLGNPQSHQNMKEVYQACDNVCDAAFPQMYIERWTWGSTDTQEIEKSYFGHENMNLKKPIFPIFDSQPDPVDDVTLEELQELLDRFPGSSIWRLPQGRERGYARDLNYHGDLRRSPIEPNLGGFPGTLGRNSQGVKTLQEALRYFGTYFAAIDGDFGSKTEAAVKAIQKIKGLPQTGEIDIETWKALGGDERPPSCQRIIDAIEKVNPEHPYYLRRDITGDGKPETFCNWFVADVLDQLSIQLPRYGSSAGSYIKPHPIYDYKTPYKPWSAEHLYNKFFLQGGNGKWQQLRGWATVANNAASGKVVLAVLAVPRNYIGDGHIAIVRPNSTANDIRIAQAGRVSSKDIGVTTGFGSKTVKYFVYVG